LTFKYLAENAVLKVPANLVETYAALMEEMSAEPTIEHKLFAKIEEL
jgi:hypothetical protein